MPTNRESQRKLISIVGLIQACSCLLGLFSVLAFWNSSYPTELFSHFRLQYCLGSGLVGIALWVLKSKKWAFAMLGVCILNVCLIAPVYWGDTPNVSGSHNDSIKIILSNVRTMNDQYEKVLGFIEKEDPHVLILQEISPLWLQELEPLK